MEQSIDENIHLDELAFPEIVPSPVEKLAEITNNLGRIPIHQLKNNLRALKCSLDLEGLLQQHDMQLPVSSQVTRDPKTFKILSYKEVETSSTGKTSKNSLALNRTPGPQKESIKGNSTTLPFWPGGFTDETIDTPHMTDDVEDYNSLFNREFLSKPPGMKSGVEFPNIEILDDSNDSDLNDDEISSSYWKGDEKTGDEESNTEKLSRELRDTLVIPGTNDNSQQHQENNAVPALKISNTPSNVLANANFRWAVMIDVNKPMTDFKERIPHMAYDYPFELDTFQKQAICRLENHENVFVAAHTSAGKTVVAEYAIALSVRHLTRTIYTSPIKALSNQKFRDFKSSFESVGLITGDVQINPTASCLIMTTEILRSMLYNGSDVIRDLEWVVFDEIHYLNNEERGHVWEEVLIMLPHHVSIIMLSATVPNALQFANWVGEIKKKKIYVITTPKRPVPLEHHLYTGSGGKSKNEQFLILDASGTLIKKGHIDAKEAKTSRMSKFQKSFGPKPGQRNTFNANSEKTTYVGLVNHLKEKDKLPVVIFTFSRNRCDTYASLLSSVDFCTGAQKAEIKGFFQRTLHRLKGSDRELPQVLIVQEMLQKGIGVHHSGILPILKEVVEMLFQKGLVKLLFATETFAMGVNMPARTVVFDSCRKHDGTQFRTLNPAEYIQMAGRAGRRGLDTTGTVIILCKQNVPDITELQNMMLGKAAKLESQFRLTYSMILNLLRVERLSVEDIMKRSFLESAANYRTEDTKEKLKLITDKLKVLEFEPISDELADNYLLIKEYLTLRDSLMDDQDRHLKVFKRLTPGRLVIMEQYPKYNARVGVILSAVPTQAGKIVIKVLILTSAKDSESLKEKGLLVSDWPNAHFLEESKIKDLLDKKFQSYLYQTHKGLVEFAPDSLDSDDAYPPHVVVTVSGGNILQILEDSVGQVNSALIEEDVRKREAPRFMNDPPSRSLQRPLEDLYTYSLRVVDGTIRPKFVKPMKDVQFKDVKLMQKFIKLYNDYNLKQGNLPDSKFLQEFRDVFCIMSLTDEKKHLEYMLSPDSLRLHVEYKARIAVLRQLNYIDTENLVQLKGRVACEMGNQNELMVTEMVLNNVLSDCPPEEIAALLSCLVFEAKSANEPEFPEGFHLKLKIEDIKTLAAQIGKTQRDCNVTDSIDNYVDQFKFGLVEVVYEWAKGKPFSEIMKLTDVQEGLIVRTIQRLDEVLRDVKDAARIIGDPALAQKMSEASECIKRDIVFAASLYTSD